MGAGGGGPSVRVLGPVSIVVDDVATVVAGGAQRRAVLALLAADLGRTVSVDRLVDALWRDPPASAVNRIQVHVTHLRRVLPDDVEVTWTGAGYVLEAPADRVDLGCFDALVTEAAAAERQGLTEVAADALARATALWDEDPVQGLGDLPCVEGLRRSLAERRARAEDRLAALLLQLDRAADAIDHLEPLVARTPYDEHRWALLVGALGAAGRSADALDAFQRARRRLDDELGIRPGPELRAAERTVLALGADPPAGAVPMDPRARFVATYAGEGPPAGPVRVARTLDFFSPGSLVGRESILAELVTRATADRPANERVSVVVAEPGAGKTHLIAELAHRLATEGVLTLYGRHSPEQYLPYEAWGQVLSTAVQQLPDGLVAALPTAVSEPLSHLVPAFGSERDLGAGLEADPAARFRFFEAVADLLDLLGEVIPVLVVLDDLQWAGTSSVALTRSVLGRGLPERVRVLVTSRPGPDDPDVRGLLAEFASDTASVDLPGLDAPAARELLAQRGVSCTVDESVRIAELSAGNPLVLQQFRSFDGTSFLAELRGIDPSQRAAALVNDRLEGMAPSTLRVLEAASLAGLDFFLDELVAVTGSPADELIIDLEPALERGLVNDPGGSDDRFSFGHALYQSVLQRRVSRHRRRKGHLALSDEAVAAGRPVAAAHHALEAGPALDPAELRVAPCTQPTGSPPIFDPDQELRLLDRLADDDRLAVVLRDDERFDLDLRRARLACVCGNWDGSRHQYLSVAAESRVLGAADVLTRVALEIDDRGRSVRLVGPRLELLEEARRRFGDGGDPVRRVELDAAWAGEVNQFGRGDAAVAGAPLVAFADEVVARARSLDDSAALASALFTRQSVGHWTGDVEGNRRLLDELLDLAAARGDDHLLHVGLLGRLRAAIQAGDRTDAEAYRERHAALAATTRHPRTTWFAMMQRSTLAQMDGHFEEADVLAAEAVTYGLEKDIPDADGAFKAALYFNLFHARRTAEIRSLVEEVVEAEPHNPLWRIGAGVAQAEAGDEAAAQASLDAVVEWVPRLPRNEFWPSVLVMSADLAHRLPPDPDRAAYLADLLEPWSGRFVVMGSMITTLGPADRALALLARQQGDVEGAAALFDAADALCERLCAAAWAVRCRDDRQ